MCGSCGTHMRQIAVKGQVLVELKDRKTKALAFLPYAVVHALQELVSDELKTHLIRTEWSAHWSGSADVQTHAVGPGAICGRVLKACADQLAPVFTDIFNLSLTLGIIPSGFKRCTIVPVPKKPPPSGLSDYRPVSLTSVVMKCFEKLVRDLITSSLPASTDPLRFAYRQNRSTDDAIAHLLHTTLTHLDEGRGNYVKMLFVDYSSAFNTIIPSLLTTKLEDLGLHTSLCDWISNFLTDRPQSVRVGNCVSSTLTLSTGAPQGCVQPVRINGSTVERVDSFRYLGVHISQVLSWSRHTNSLAKKARQRLYHLRCLRDFRLPSKVLRNFYTCTIESILTGNITVWFGNSTKQDRQALQRVITTTQKLTIRIRHNKHFSAAWAAKVLVMSVCCAVTLDMMQACALLLFLFPVQVSLLHTELSVPQNVLLEKDLVSQTLSLTWESDSSVFDVEIFRTELGELVLNETVLARVYARTRRWSWSWRSEVPLQCTSHSVHIRARDQHTVSQWSRLLTISGLDLPEKAEAQMYPQDTVVTVGSNVTFCCILPEGQAGEGHIRYMNKELKVTMLSHRTIATSVDNLPASHPTGTNVICSMPANSVLTGAVVFVGCDEGLQCETRDLVSAECYWNKGQDTHLRKTSYQTQYTLNGRRCVEAGRDRKQCRFDQWQDTWTLMAVNPLGTVRLNDSAKLIERAAVHLVAPVNILAVPQMRNATLQWTWSAQRYKTLDMICQVHLTNRGRTHAYNYTGVGLSSVILEGLIPDAQYSVSVCCASLHNFWRWGDFSSPYSVRTKMDRPEAPDVWVRMDSEDTGRVLWKPLSGSASHGPLLGYEVYLKAGEEVGWKSLFLSSNASSSLISLSNSSRNVIVAVAARNPVGLSKRSAIPIPKFQAVCVIGVLVCDGLVGYPCKCVLLDASLFPDVMRAIGERRTRDGSSSPGREKHRLVGFGEHQSVSYRDLYEGKHREKRRQPRPADPAADGEAWEQDGGAAKVHPGQRREGERPDTDVLRNRGDHLPICACSGTSGPSSRCHQPLEFHSQQARTGAFRCRAAGSSSSSAPEVPAPPQHSLPTAEPEKQPSQTQPVPTAEMSSTSPPLVLLW
ncbi:hypothetical protein P4O66_000179 [Electrophorus voltai]|uniref:Fibronectin type-III domain-containing protein n=1 Tax=Electrophorus voltai TaxID=2609070 RepID=A0AAD8ZVX9_9TELE|nr:hypothetical protein P4O66_000179 [Electrophorus voltai]